MIAIGLAALAVALPGFTRTPALEKAATAVAGRPAYVMCANSLAAWEAGKLADGWAGQNVWGFTDFSDSFIYLHPNGCRILKSMAAGKPVVAPLLLKAGFATTLTHESIHVSGVRDEAVTECTAMHTVPSVLVRFFHVKPGKQLRAWMTAAWTVHRTEPPPYQDVC